METEASTSASATASVEINRFAVHDLKTILSSEVEFRKYVIIENEKRGKENLNISEKLAKIEKSIKKLKKEQSNKPADLVFGEIFPITNQEMLSEMEVKLEDADYFERIVSIYIRLNKYNKEWILYINFFQKQLLKKNVPSQPSSFVGFLKRIMDIQLLVDYNWDGKAGKKQLKNLNLISGTLKGKFKC